MVCRLCHTAKRTHGTKNFLKPDLGNSRAILYKEHGSMDDLIEYSHPSSSGPLLWMKATHPTELPVMMGMFYMCYSIR